MDCSIMLASSAVCNGRMDSSYEAAQGVVRELCVNFMRALPKDMQAEMDGSYRTGGGRTECIHLRGKRRVI